MAKINIPYFGLIDPFNIEEEYTSGLEHRGKEVMLDLNIEGPWVEPYKLEAVKKFLGRLITMDEKNRQYLYEEYRNPDVTCVRYYFEYHLEKVWRPALEKLIDFNNKDITPIDQLFKSLHLIRVGIYPENEDVFAVFDYCIDPDYTEYVIALNFSRQGKLQEMTMEL